MMDILIAYLGMVLTAMSTIGLVTNQTGLKYSRVAYWISILGVPFIICGLMVVANDWIFVSLPELKRMYCG